MIIVETFPRCNASPAADHGFPLKQVSASDPRLSLRISRFRLPSIPATSAHSGQLVGETEAGSAGRHPSPRITGAHRADVQRRGSQSFRASYAWKKLSDNRPHDWAESPLKENALRLAARHPETRRCAVCLPTRTAAQWEAERSCKNLESIAGRLECSGRSAL